MFVASVRCPALQHPNDFDFRFCQRCGYNRKILKAATIGEVSVDLDAIDARIQQLLNYDKATSYAKQKDSLRKELGVSFLPCQAISHLPLSPRVTCVVF